MIPDELMNRLDLIAAADGARHVWLIGGEDEV